MYLFDVRKGVAGDMILGSFIDISDCDLDMIKTLLERAGSVMSDTKVNIMRTEEGVRVLVHHKKFDGVSGISMREYIEKSADVVGVPADICRKIIDTLLSAEAEVHNVDVTELHLHETGSPDTIVDIVGVAYFYEILQLERNEVCSTVISVGRGTVRTSHGLMNVPAPATERLLHDLKWVYGPYEGEMATPTGVSILKCLINYQIDNALPPSKRKGVGFGTRRFPSRTSVNLLLVE